MKTKNPSQKNRIALVFQGGGALGAYQAGIYQAMHENGLTPDWVVGTSIGAINAAIISGNPPDTRLERLQEFWEIVAQPDTLDMRAVPDPVRKFNIFLTTLDAMWRGVPGFFSPRILNPFAIGLPVSAEQASFYDTANLTVTLNKLIDFDYLNAGNGPRLTVNAVKVTSGELVGFDNRHQNLGVDHIMASGALPPGFPAVRIGNDLFWDGGLYSNTPLETVLEDEPRKDTLCFMIDLWSADGAEPNTVQDVQTRQKDIIFGSRSKRHIQAYEQLHNMRRAVHALQEKLPTALKHSKESLRLQKMSCATTMHIVRLPYSGLDWNMPSKDLNFSKGSIKWRWELGYNNAMRAIEQAGWLTPVPDDVGVVLHELAPKRK